MQLRTELQRGMQLLHQHIGEIGAGAQGARAESDQGPQHQGLLDQLEHQGVAVEALRTIGTVGDRLRHLNHHLCLVLGDYLPDLDQGPGQHPQAEGEERLDLEHCPEQHPQRVVDLSHH